MDDVAAAEPVDRRSEGYASLLPTRIEAAIDTRTSGAGSTIQTNQFMLSCLVQRIAPHLRAGMVVAQHSTVGVSGNSSSRAMEAARSGSTAC